jgi:two-component system, NtrC family, response regulator GlrR
MLPRERKPSAVESAGEGADGCDVREPSAPGLLLGESPAIRRVLERIRRIASTEANVLINGETGTGKELAARAIHYLGARREFPFIPVNCGALPETLVENELFGHERGAFTDARGDSRGLLRLAHRGTLFLDEVDALPRKGQVVLLRFLQDRRFRPLGARHEQQADVRIIAASNTSLESLIERREFRSDLYYRLHMMSLDLPPLRARGADIELLARHFIRDCASLYRRPEKPLHPQTLEWFRAYPWPGNVRELENLIHREFLMSDDENVIACACPSACEAPAAEETEDGTDRPLQPYADARLRAIEEFDRAYLRMLLGLAGGNVSRAARMACKERRALGKLIKRYAIVPSSFRS